MAIYLEHFSDTLDVLEVKDRESERWASPNTPAEQKVGLWLLVRSQNELFFKIQMQSFKN